MRTTGDGGVRWEETEDALKRYATIDMIGGDSWRTLVERVVGVANASAVWDPARDILQQFFDETSRLRTTSKPRRLFISHQRNDAHYAERLAYLAKQRNIDYWLDIHDPTLTWANSQTISGPQKAVLIAAIIEIALLNCTGVIAVHSKASAGSKWIPYEFGRAKLHVPFSVAAAGWFHPDVQQNVAAEYFELGPKTYGEKKTPTVTTTPWNPWIPVTDWLGPIVTNNPPWSGSAVAPNDPLP